MSDLFFALPLSIGFGFPMVFRLPVLDRYQFLEVSPIQKGTESSNLASGNSLSDFSPDCFRFSKVSSGWILVCPAIWSHPTGKRFKTRRPVGL